jgi:hypothetical protein
MYGKNLQAITTDPSHRRFVIAVGERYLMRSRHSTPTPVFITVYEATSLKPIPIDGEYSVSVLPSITPDSLIFYVPSGKL